MTMKQDVLNELRMCDGITFKEMRSNLDEKETSLSPCLTDMKKNGLIEQIGKLYYLTGEGRELYDTNNHEARAKTPEEKNNKPDQKTSTQSHPEDSKKIITNHPPITDQLNKLKQQINVKIPENIELKIQVCDEIGELLSDDLRAILLDISADYKKLSSVD